MDRFTLTDVFTYRCIQVPDCILNPDLSKKKHKRHPIHRALGGRSMAGFTQDTSKQKEVSLYYCSHKSSFLDTPLAPPYLVGRLFPL